MKEIRSLTSLRGIAALWVMLFHVQLLRPGSIPWHSRLLSHGYLAVDIFFVLSGFVMALTYRASFEDRPFANAFSDFMVKRIGRVVPLHAVLVLGIALVAATIGASVAPTSQMLARARDPLSLLANVLLIQEWVPVGAIIPPAWSVSQELGAYVAFPLLIWIAWGRGWAFGAGIAVVGLITMIYQGHGSLDVGASPANKVTRCFAEFYVGLLVFRVWTTRPPQSLASWVPPVLAVVTLSLLAVLQNDGPYILLFPALIYVLAQPGGLLGRPLSWTPLHYLGDISYSIYLMHWCVIWAVGLLPLPPMTVAPVAIIVTLLGSVATYHLIEVPARRFVRNLYVDRAITSASSAP